MSKIPHKILLTEDEIPRKWYNLVADMKTRPAPPINPQTMKPATPEDFYPLFSEELSRQEFSTEQYIDIPEEIIEMYKIYRPSPLIRAYPLEKALDTPAKIYYKYEGNNTSGSHKLNSAIPQVYYNMKEGIKNLTTETGAGQWGTALSIACGFYDIPLTVYMVKASTQQKPYRKAIMETFGAKVIASPSDTTAAGRAILKDDPDCGGSLGCAISEAVETAMGTPNTKYVLGSVLNHVAMHQSIIGLEAKAQMEKIGEMPDLVIACAGGGSNMAGLMAAFMKDKLEGKQSPEFIAAEPAACPSLTRGKFAYDYCDVSKTTPMAKMYTLGSGFMPAAIHSGGLRYHGMSPILSQLYHDGYITARSCFQKEVFDAATLFAKHETILPAPESAHAIKVAIDEALRCKESGEAKTILIGLSGHGNFDLTAYMNYNSGNIQNYAPTDEELAKGFAGLPEVSLAD